VATRSILLDGICVVASGSEKLKSFSSISHAIKSHEILRYAIRYSN
jgi:hypothetical protein